MNSTVNCIKIQATSVCAPTICADLAKILSSLLFYIRLQIYQWCAEQPKTAFVFAIIASTGLLPFVTVAALTPLVLIVNITDFIADNGLIYVMYILLFRWLFLVILVIALFIIVFVLGSSVGILYSRELNT